MHLRRLRRILDQLNQVIAKDNLPRSAGQICADPVAFGRRIMPVRQGLDRILRKMRSTFGQVAAAGFNRLGNDFGIEQRLVRGGQHVKRLAGQKPGAV